MKRASCLLFCLLAVAISFLSGASAQTSDSSKKIEVETEWPGIRLQVVRFDRVLQNRVMLVVRLQATGKTPAAGIFLGTASSTPLGKATTDPSLYSFKSFSLASSTMTVEPDGASYQVLPTLEPPGKAYFPSATMALLHPGQSELLSIQFTAPPLPTPPPPGQTAIPPTVSFSLPKVKGPIVHVPLPPSVVNGAKSNLP